MNAFTMNAYEKAVSLRLTQSDQAAADVLNILTLRPIMLDDLMPVLNFRGMLTKTDGNDGGEKWKGAILQMKAALVAASIAGDHATEEEIAAAAVAAAYVKEVEKWFSHITNPRNIRWDTTDPLYAKPFAVMRAQFANSGIFKAGDFEAIYALGGGTYQTTAAEIAAQRAAAEAAQWKLELSTWAETLREQYGERHNEVLHKIKTEQLTTTEGVTAALRGD